MMLALINFGADNAGRIRSYKCMIQATHGGASGRLERKSLVPGVGRQVGGGPQHSGKSERCAV